MEYDLHHKVNQRVGLEIQAITGDTTTVGPIIDAIGYESLEYVVQAGVITDGTYTVLIEDGEDSLLADAAPVPANLILDSLPVLDASDTIFRVGVISKKRYIRLSLVSTAVTTGGTLGSSVVLGNAEINPPPE